MATQLSQTSLLMQLAGTSNTKTSSTFSGLLSMGGSSQGADISGFSGFSSLMSEYSVNAKLVASGTFSSGDSSGLDNASSLAALVSRLEEGGNALPLDGGSLSDQLAALTQSLTGWQTMLGANSNQVSTGDLGMADMMPSGAASLLALMANVENGVSSGAGSLSSVFDELSQKLSDTLDTLRSMLASLDEQALPATLETGASGVYPETTIVNEYESVPVSQDVLLDAVSADNSSEPVQTVSVSAEQATDELNQSAAEGGETEGSVSTHVFDTRMSEQLITKLKNLLDDIEKITGEKADAQDGEADSTTALALAFNNTSLETPRDVVGLIEQVVNRLQGVETTSETLNPQPLAAQQTVSQASLSQFSALQEEDRQQEWYDLTLGKVSDPSAGQQNGEAIPSDDVLSVNASSMSENERNLSASANLVDAALEPLSATSATDGLVSELSEPEIAAALVAANRANQATKADQSGVSMNATVTQGGSYQDSGSQNSTNNLGGGAALASNASGAVQTPINSNAQAAPADVAVASKLDQSMRDQDIADVGRRNAALNDESASNTSIRDRAETSLSGLTQAASALNRTSTPVQMNMPAGMNPGQPGWSEAMSERVVWASKQGVQTATLQLDPPELGSLQVKLHITHDQVSVSFSSPHASVRDSVEQSMPRLKEMLEEQGLSLGESSVNDQGASSSDRDRDEQTGVASRDGRYDASREEGAEVSENENKSSLSLVDYYA
ncbi:flagellar hook-length control protein FliK [Neptunomonas phycophila]|uniref:flagellar hook-length control protein FliK n=1 Tax=Neptunomonas phycophila TaxID=1572645 RepID=UPI001BE5D557|nr:flagellar hook-length control protein FliK [Neptunomonas phycophila]MBT3144361.1 flagellar hook-length control protein FliK [Neptunomonas phycophila]